MRKIGTFLTLALVAVLFSACGETATNKPANNANAANTAAKTEKAAPTMEALIDMDKKANEAWIKGDKAYFEGFLSDKFVSFERGERMTRADVLAMIGTFKCDVKTWSLDEPQMAKIDADTYVVSYKGTFDGTCTGPDGKAEKLPSPMRAASIYVRNGDKWQGAFHGETMIVDPKAPPAPATKEEPKKAEAKKDDKAASDTATAPAKPTPSANTDALVKLHASGWEAWRTKDAKALTDMSTANLSIVNPIGMWMSGRDGIVKAWTEMKCEGVTKTSFSNGFASAFSPTVELLTGTGSADGTCDGQKNGDLHSAAVYVKEGDAWKLAFMFETPGM